MVGCQINKKSRPTNGFLLGKYYETEGGTSPIFVRSVLQRVSAAYLEPLAAYLEPPAEDVHFVHWVFTVLIILSVAARPASAARFARPARRAPPARPASAASPTMPTIHIYEDAESVLRIPDIASIILFSIEFVFVCTSIAGRRLAALSF